MIEYKKWVSELLEHGLEGVYAPYFVTHLDAVTNSIAAKMENELPDFLDDIAWCDDCEKCQDSDPEPSEAYLEARER